MEDDFVSAFPDEEDVAFETEPEDDMPAQEMIEPVDQLPVDQTKPKSKKAKSKKVSVAEQVADKPASVEQPFDGTSSLSSSARPSLTPGNPQ